MYAPTPATSHEVTFALGSEPVLHCRNPFQILNKIAKEVPTGSDVRLELRSQVGSLEVAHLVSIWRLCASRKLRFHALVFSELAYNVLASVGLDKMFPIALCRMSQQHLQACDPSDETCVHYCPDGSSCAADGALDRA